MSPLFFPRYLDIIGPSILTAMPEALNTGSFPTKLNHTHIILILKKDRPERVGDCRSISLCNVLYKLILKVIAYRLKRWMHCLIYPIL